MNYKMIFSDMDGTLLTSDNRISEKNKKAINKAVELGVEFVICTGRGLFGVERYLKELNLIGKTGYVICQNGATVYDTKTMSLVINEAFLAKDFEPIVHFARNIGVEIYYYNENNFVAEKETERVKKYRQTMGDNLKIIDDPIVNMTSFTKCLMSGTKEQLAAINNKTKEIADSLFDCFYSGEAYIEIVKKGINKGDILAETAKKANIPLNQVIAIGDSDNDVPMLKKAGLGIAMINADDNVKLNADFITQNNCNESAIAEIVEKFIIKHQ